jgi:hypothetical protein
LKSVGVIPVTFIKDIRYKEFPIDDKRHCFELVTDQSRYLISASSDREMKAWAAAINYARNLQLNNSKGATKIGTVRVEILQVAHIGVYRAIECIQTHARSATCCC